MRRRHGALLLFVIARRSGSARGRPFSKNLREISRWQPAGCAGASVTPPIHCVFIIRTGRTFQACKARSSVTSCSNEGGVAVVRNGGSYTNSFFCSRRPVGGVFVGGRFCETPIRRLTQTPYN